MLGDTPVTVYWTMLYNSCILLIYSFCDSSHIVTKRSILFRVSTKATVGQFINNGGAREATGEATAPPLHML